MIEAIVAGHLCLDIIPQFTTTAGDAMSAYISPGRLTELGQAALSTGGAVSNTGINLHRLGIETRLAGRLGDDLFGRAILDIVKAHGARLAEGMSLAPGEISSYTVVINPPRVDRAFLHCPGANHTFGAEDIRPDLLAQARLFHFGYPPLMRRMYDSEGTELVGLFARVRQLGLTTSLDLAMPEVTGPSGQVDWDVILRRVLPHVHLFLPSIEELLFMLDRPTFDDLDRSVGPSGMLEAIHVDTIRRLAERALAYGCSIVTLKLGTRGIYMRTAPELGDLGRGAPTDLSGWQGRELWAHPFRPRRVASTVGAGDAAIAGFLAAWLRGTAPSTALNMAAAAGASCVEEAGAVSGVRSWQETLQRLQAGWERLSAEPPGPGWLLDRGSGLWRGTYDASP